MKATQRGFGLGEGDSPDGAKPAPPVPKRPRVEGDDNRREPEVESQRQIFIAERLLERRVLRGREQYLVRWQGYASAMGRSQSG